jgi:hypothetical protein
MKQRKIAPVYTAGRISRVYWMESGTKLFYLFLVMLLSTSVREL